MIHSIHSARRGRPRPQSPPNIQYGTTLPHWSATETISRKLGFPAWGPRQDAPKLGVPHQRSWCKRDNHPRTRETAEGKPKKKERERERERERGRGTNQTERKEKKRKEKKRKEKKKRENVLVTTANTATTIVTATVIVIVIVTVVVIVSRHRPPLTVYVAGYPVDSFSFPHEPPRHILKHLQFPSSSYLLLRQLS